MRDSASLTVSIPIVVGILLTLVFALAECAGLRPFARRPVSVAEAAALDDAPELLRQLHGGANPLARYLVGTDVIPGPVPQSLTPLEAATARDRPGIIGLIERWGVPIDDRERAHLLCVAEQAGATQAAEVLKRDGVTSSCGTAETGGDSLPLHRVP
ncbi:MAG: hypothetical protein ABMA15_27100 [Vicinamibacterales bacterium]